MIKKAISHWGKNVHVLVCRIQIIIKSRLVKWHAATCHWENCPFTFISQFIKPSFVLSWRVSLYIDECFQINYSQKLEVLLFSIVYFKFHLSLLRFFTLLTLYRSCKTAGCTLNRFLVCAGLTYQYMLTAVWYLMLKDFTDLHKLVILMVQLNYEAQTEIYLVKIAHKCLSWK